MKGITFNMLEEVVRDQYGEDTWDDLLEAASLGGAYTSLGNYPDEDLFRLVSVASIALKLPPDDVVRWFGRSALPIMARSYPSMFEGHTNTRSFLLTLNHIIHPEVRKLYPGADVPTFDFDTSSDEVIFMGYRSHRKLCAFAHGLVEGAALHFGEPLSFEHLECMHRGDSKCLFAISFS